MTSFGAFAVDDEGVEDEVVEDEGVDEVAIDNVGLWIAITGAAGGLVSRKGSTVG